MRATHAMTSGEERVGILYEASTSVAGLTSSMVMS